MFVLDSQDKEIAQNFYKGAEWGSKLKHPPKLNMSSTMRKVLKLVLFGFPLFFSSFCFCFLTIYS
jgi:hypothetical protein